MTIMKTRLLNLLTIVWLVTVAVPLSAQTVSATDFVRAKADELIAIVNREVVPGTDEARQRQDELKAAVRQFIDYRELCLRALGNHWTARSAEEQDSFVELMTRLIETNYTVKLGNRHVGSNYQVLYDGEQRREELAVVSGSVTVDQEQTMVEIYLLARDDSWLVFDVVTDDVSMVETYAESYDEIISDEGWDALIQRLTDRLAELEEELATQAQGADPEPATQTQETDPELGVQTQGS